ncbi:MAG: cytochrome c [Chloroflexota bacterium]
MIKPQWIILPVMACLWAAIASPATAQDEEPDPVNGATIYASRCANCHGSLGMGDGELADSLPNQPTAIGSAEYLASKDTFSIAQAIYNGNLANGMPGFGPEINSNPLTNQEIFDIVAGLEILPQMNEPIPTARVLGQAGNGSTGALLDGGVVTLQTFTPELEEAGAFTTDILADGSFIFDLSNLPPNWFYRTVVNHKGLDFSSGFSRLTPFETESELNVVVFDQSADDSAIRVWQHQTLVDFGPETVQVAQIYLFTNSGNEVYAGESAESGTVQIPIPPNAENVIFLQGFGAADFSPVTDPVVEGDVWRPNLPILPGEGTLQLLMRYVLPYEPGMTISHPIPYPTDFIELSLPDSGAAIVAEGDPWRPEAPETNSVFSDENSRVSFSRPPLPPNGEFSFQLTGFPSLVIDSNGNRLVQRDEFTETLVGSVILVIVAAIVAITAYSWTQQPAPASPKEELVQRIAAVDLAYEEKAIKKRIWQQKRRKLLDELKSIW